MWVLKRIQEGSNKRDEVTHYLLVGEHLIGRKGCAIQVLGDQTVSRKHAYITVNTGAGNITIKDVSKFGTAVNKVKCKTSESTELEDGDEITFGTQNSTYWLSREPLVVFASCLDNSKKKLLKTNIAKLGGSMVNEWQKDCTHLVMDALSFTVKVIYALVTCCPIVTSSYFEELLKQISSNSELPTTTRYMPPIKEELIEPNLVSFHPNEARKSLFAGKKFLFFEEKQYKRLGQAIILAGGTPLLKENGDVNNDQDLLTDVNTLVMSMDLKSKTTPDKELWIGHVGDVLTSRHRRPIAETEVGLAILHISLEEYCNPSVNHIPRITKHIVSKSLSSMEAMSQRGNESQNISIMSIPEKNPLPCSNVERSRRSNSTNSPKVIREATRKRSRVRSSDDVLLASDTPLSEHALVENKRLKMSPPDVPEVPHTSPSRHLRPKGNPSKDDDVNNTPSSKLEVTHISQSQEQPSTTSPGKYDRKRHGGLMVPKLEITYVSESQESNSSEPKEPVEISHRSGRKKLSLSTSKVAHISQESQESNSSEPKEPVEISHRSSRKKLSLSTSKAEKAHISQEGPPVGNPRTPKSEITPISQSQNSSSLPEKLENMPDSQNRKKGNSTTSKSEVTGISQNQELHVVPDFGYPEEKHRSLRIPKSEITHISQSQNSPPIPEELNDMSGSSDTKKPKSSILKPEITPCLDSPFLPGQQKQTKSERSLNIEKRDSNDIKSELAHISLVDDNEVGNVFMENSGERKRQRVSDSESELMTKNISPKSTPEVVCETPSPEISSQGKRRKVVAIMSDITHISETERTIAEANTSRLTDISFGLDQSISFTSHKEETHTKHSVKKEVNEDIEGVQPGYKVLESFSAPKIHSSTQETSNNKPTETNVYIKSEKDTSGIVIDSGNNLEIGDEQVGDVFEEDPPKELGTKGSHVNIPGSGWFSKKSSQRAKLSEISENNNVQVKKEYDVNENVVVVKEVESVEVKKEVDMDLPKDLISIEYVELLVPRQAPRKNRAPQNASIGTNLRNTKKFRKQNYPGSDRGLPRIIGGSDLVIFSSTNKDVENWFNEIQQRNREQDLEDQDADDLFRYEPSTKRRKRQ